MNVLTDGPGPRGFIVALAEGCALMLLGAAVWLGSREFVGTFGVTSEAKSCGSVWGLLSTADLNAATCKDELLDRLILVAVMLGVAGLVAAATPLLVWRRPNDSPPSRVSIALAVLIPIAASAAMIAVGRHLAWSVSGA